MSINELVLQNLSERQKRILRKIQYYLKGGSKSACRLDSKCKLPYKILIGTHHKTGSKWMHSIFAAICHYHSLIYYYGSQDGLPEEFDVFLEDHSRFNFNILRKPYRGIHLIRDPRDLIVSGSFYHQKSNEKWLHVPQKEFHGLTYNQKINSYKDFDDKMLFEMEHSARRNIFDMKQWNYSHPNFYELKYEDIINDKNLILFHKLFIYLGFQGSIIPSLLAISYNKSLFSGRLKKTTHIRSGKASQWKKYFMQIHKKRFIELFGDTLIKLGYEKDNNW